MPEFCMTISPLPQSNLRLRAVSWLDRVSIHPAYRGDIRIGHASPSDVTDITGHALKGRVTRRGKEELISQHFFEPSFICDSKCRTFYLQELFFLNSLNSRVTASREDPIICAAALNTF